MKMLLLPVFCSLLPGSLMATSTAIPETIDMGAYSVQLKLTDDWRVEVSAKNGTVKYQYVDPLSHGASCVELRVFRMPVPEATTRTSPETMADALVIKDGLRFHRQVFGDHKRLRCDDPKGIQSPLGRTRHYTLSREEHDRAGQRFVHVALIIAGDFQTSNTVFLITGYEVNGENHLAPEWADLVNDIIRGLQTKG
jgi:hypothetical protein